MNNGWYIDKYEIINVNPYVVVLEDKSVMNIYSLIEKNKHYRFKIEECKILNILNIITTLEFLSFVEIAHGHITLDQEKFYKH